MDRGGRRSALKFAKVGGLWKKFADSGITINNARGMGTAYVPQQHGNTESDI